MKKRLITAGCVLFWLVVWQLGAAALDREISKLCDEIDGKNQE